MRFFVLAAAVLCCASTELFAQCKFRKQWDQQFWNDLEKKQWQHKARCKLCMKKEDGDREGCENWQDDRIKMTEKYLEQWKPHEKKCKDCKEYCFFWGRWKSEIDKEWNDRTKGHNRECKLCSMGRQDECEMMKKKAKHQEEAFKRHSENCDRCSKTNGGREPPRRDEPSAESCEEVRKRCEALEGECKKAFEEHKEECKRCKDGKASECEWAQENERHHEEAREKCVNDHKKMCNKCSEGEHPKDKDKDDH